MKLRGVDFGNVLGASGVMGFFGEGYWFHKFWYPFGFDLSGVTFVSKTTTLTSRQGNMPLKKDYTPQDLFPGCVTAQFLTGNALNAVGLSGPGLVSLLNTRNWQQRAKPLLISIMPVGDFSQTRINETRRMLMILSRHRDEFKAPVGIQINVSCPNVGHDLAKLVDEINEILSVAGGFGFPIMPKFSIASAPIRAVLELEQHPSCDAICVSNTLPWGWEGVDWQKIWGSKTSPLAKLGGGGLSGKALRPLVCEWIARLRNAGFTKPINGGGGILEVEDVDAYYKAGASSIFIGSVAILRPWRVKAIVDRANKLVWR